MTFICNKKHYEKIREEVYIMKRKIIYIIGILLIFTCILVFTFRKSIFQCGNPIPYVGKMITLNEEKEFAKVYSDKEIYITKNGDYEDLHKYIEDKYKVSFLDQMGNGFILVSYNERVILTSEVYYKNYDVWNVTIKKEKLYLEDLSIEQLIKAIDKNLEDFSEFGEQAVKERKDDILNYDWGLVSYIDNNYKTLSQKDKLIR